MSTDDERGDNLRYLNDAYRHDTPPEDPGESTAWATAPGAPTPNPHADTGEAAWAEQDTDTEAKLLSALLYAGETGYRHLEDALAQLTPADFADTRHIAIYQAIQAIQARGEGVDFLTLQLHLKNTKALSSVGGPGYLSEILTLHGEPAMATIYTASLIHYAQRRATATLARDLDRTARTAAEDELDTRVHDHLTHAATRLAPRGHATTTSTWAPMDLADVLSGEITAITPTVLTRSDGEHLLYPGKVHSISGEPGSGKSWLAILGVAQQLLSEAPALYLDFEDRPQTLIERLRAINVPDHLIATHLRYVRPEQALDPAGELALLRAAQDCPLAILDGVTEAMGLHGLEMNDNTDVARFLSMLPRRIADAGPAVLQVDHVVKNAEARGRYAIGGQHKLAGIDGVAYKAVVAKPMARGIRGSTRIIIDKDRGGYVGPTGLTAAELILDASRTDYGEKTDLWAGVPAPEISEETGDFRPTIMMEKVSKYVEINPEATQTSMEKLKMGKATSLRQAIATLIAEGYLATATGPRNATHLRSIRAYRQSDDH